MFTTDKPVIFAYHGYPWLIHRLCYRRRGHDNFHVHGYQEEGTTTTPFDMTVMNDWIVFILPARWWIECQNCSGPAPIFKSSFETNWSSINVIRASTATICRR